ncbi:hypothetical protein IV59_GL002133 [Paucilactobacillus hokkaidonensis]|nr:hypothetical protein IV59_GL002133 [Paucilactobacillus hokkaidonensis]
MRALQIETSFLPITLFILGILLFVTGITTTVVFSRRIQQLKEEHQQKIEKDTKQYIQMLETSYENLKRSKHDFKNTLLSLEYLSQKNNYDKVYDAINEILDSQLLTTRSNEHKFDLNQIKDEFMHSIVAQKVDEAESKKITVSLEFGSTIPVLKTNRAEIVRITGILLDNAIDAANQSSKRNITIAIVNTDDNIELSIRNTVADNVKINLTKIFVSGYSTKDSSRGIGLATVRELVDQLNSKVLFNVSYDEQVNEFTATLILINNEK